MRARRTIKDGAGRALDGGARDRRSARGALVLVSIGTVLLAGSTAFATTELPAYDAQSVAEAAAGVAHISNGSSLYHNPATLAGIHRFSVEFVLSPLMPANEVPLTGNGSAERSSFGIAPLFLLGAAYRLTDRFVLSVATYPSTGFGMTFKSVPLATEPRGNGEQSVRTLNMELAVGGSYSILDNLSVGVAYRITRAQQVVEHYGIVDTLDLSGASFFGLHAGILYEPVAGLSLGASWRSKVVTDVSGTLTMLNQNFAARSQVASPHAFKLGGAYRMLDDRLMFTAGVQYALYSDSHQQQVVITNVAGSDIQQTTELGWHNTLAGGVGIQCFVLPELALRGGFSLAQSATPNNRPGPFQVPPGWLKSISTGVGYVLPNWEFDLALFYSFLRTTVMNPEPVLAPGATGSQAPDRFAGTYGMRLVMLSMGTTYHF